MLQDMQKVSAIVIHYDGARFIDSCLSAVRKMPEVSEIIFVDDGSPETPEEQVARHGATFVGLPENRGPVAARNEGARRATGEYLLFLDVDVVPERDYAATLLAPFEEDARVGAAIGTLMQRGERMWFSFGYDPARFRDAAQEILGRLVIASWKLAPLRRALMRLARPFTLNFAGQDRTIDVDWVAEGCFMTRRELFEELGGFDEGYVMFFEGPDYCRRVRNADYRVLYVPGASCDHRDGKSHAPATRKELFAASRKRYLRKFG